jgi:hypothetical protein
MQKIISKWLNQSSCLLLSLMMAILLQYFFSLEWSLPVCQNTAEWVDSAALGFPFPYMKWSGVSSMQYDVMVHIYAFNVLIITAVIFIFLRKIYAQVLPATKNKTHIAISFLSLLCLILVLVLSILLFQNQGLTSVMNIAHSENGAQYMDYRPVGWAIQSDVSDYNCKPSDFWFVEGLEKQ